MKRISKNKNTLILIAVLVIIIPLIIVFAQKQVISQAADSGDRLINQLEEKITRLNKQQRLNQLDIASASKLRRILSDAADELAKESKQLEKDITAVDQQLEKKPRNRTLINTRNALSRNLTRNDEIRKLAGRVAKTQIKEVGRLSEAINLTRRQISKTQSLIRTLKGPIFLICVTGLTFFCFDVDPAYAGFSTFVDPISTPPATPPERLKKVEEAIIPFIKFRSSPPTTPLPSTIPQ